MTQEKPHIGIVGMPPISIIKQLESEQCIVTDLDEPVVKKSIDSAAIYLPRVYCAILRTVVVNAINLNLDRIYIDTGAGKCDAAQHTATILQDCLPTTRIIETKNDDNLDFGFPLCETEMNLLEKMSAITKTVQSSSLYKKFTHCKAEAGFWGVPPRDFSLLSLFPDKTHVFGWARCMENKTPDNLSLEQSYDPNIPTVFFAQSFCSKSALAKHLADKHPCSLYLDCDVTASNSIKAKIEAFLELSTVDKK